MDILLGLTALVLSLPVQAAVALMILISMGRPLLYVQMRPGLDGEPFQLLKFRTLRNPDGERGLQSDDERLTCVGRLLRGASLDELPELWNVLRGDMSLVGPRPLLMEYLPLYTADQARRHEALPGLTGWAQIHGRNLLSWEEKFALDVWYVQNQNLLLDVQILASTLVKVVAREGISQEGRATTQRFRGEQDGGHRQ